MPRPSTASRRPVGPTRALLVVLVGLGLAAIVAACAGSDGGDGSGASGSTATTGRPPATATVTITDGRFDPRQVTIAVGGSVTWVNRDLTDHTVAFLSANVIGSPRIGKAGSYTRSFDAPGEYRYYCSIHNEMKGTVVVR